MEEQMPLFILVEIGTCGFKKSLLSRIYFLFIFLEFSAAIFRPRF